MALRESLFSHKAGTFKFKGRDCMVYQQYFTDGHGDGSCWTTAVDEFRAYIRSSDEICNAPQGFWQEVAAGERKLPADPLADEFWSLVEGIQAKPWWDAWLDEFRKLPGIEEA